MSDGIVVARVDRVDFTPAAELSVRGWLELLEKGHSSGALNLRPDLPAMIGYAPNGRDLLPVGVLTFEVEPDRLWIYHSWVVPEFRGRGVYTAMWNELVKYATEHTRVKIIFSDTAVRNSAMRAIAAKQGRVEVGVLIRYDIPR